MKFEKIKMLACKCSRDESNGLRITKDVTICTDCGSMISNGHQRITIDTLQNEVIEDINYTKAFYKLEVLEEEGKL